LVESVNTQSHGRTLMVVLVSVIVILGATTVAVYATLQGQVSELKKENADMKSAAYSVCTDYYQNGTQTMNFWENVTTNGMNAWRDGILLDQAMIATLNSTRPPGYENLTANLQAQIDALGNFVNQTNADFNPQQGVGQFMYLCSPFAPSP
jgi:hypothetical protein